MGQFGRVGRFSSAVPLLVSWTVWAGKAVRAASAVRAGSAGLASPKLGDAEVSLAASEPTPVESQSDLRQIPAGAARLRESDSAPQRHDDAEDSVTLGDLSKSVLAAFRSS